jgi:hypothetical protein
MTDDNQDVVMIDRTSIDQEVLMIVESRKRSNAYINGRLNRSLTPQTQSRKIIQIRFSPSPESELVCYPMRISNIHVPDLHTPQAVIDSILRLGTAEEIESIPIACGLMEADGTVCIDLGFTYAEDAMALLVDHGSNALRAPTDEGHVWHVSPITRIAAGRTCTVYPKALGCLSPRPISSRRRVLLDALSRERKIEAVDPTVAHLFCIAQMESLLIAMGTQENVDFSPQDPPPAPQQLDPFRCSLTSIADEQWNIMTEDSALLKFQSQWPLPRPAITVPQQPILEATQPTQAMQLAPATQSASATSSQPAQKKKKKNKQKQTDNAAPVNDTQDRPEMTGSEIALARRATRVRAEELYEAWHSDKIPLPSVPMKAPVEQPTENAMVIEPGQQRAKSGLSRCGWRDLRRVTNYAARVLADDDAYENEAMCDEVAELSALYPGWRKRREREQENRRENIDRHNARNIAAKAASDNEFILIWDWYARCMPIIESARVSMAIPSLAWPDDLKPMKDEDITACALSQSFESLQKQFSPPGRLPKLRGQHLDYIRGLIASRQDASRQQSSNDTGQWSR